MSFITLRGVNDGNIHIFIKIKYKNNYFTKNELISLSRYTCVIIIIYALKIKSSCQSIEGIINNIYQRDFISFISLIN